MFRQSANASGRVNQSGALVSAAAAAKVRPKISENNVNFFITTRVSYHSVS